MGFPHCPLRHMLEEHAYFITLVSMVLPLLRGVPTHAHVSLLILALFYNTDVIYGKYVFW